jgi:hypothetical protein
VLKRRENVAERKRVAWLEVLVCAPWIRLGVQLEPFRTRARYPLKCLFRRLSSFLNMPVTADNGQQDLAPDVEDRENTPVESCFRNSFKVFSFNVFSLSSNMPVLVWWTSDRGSPSGQHLVQKEDHRFPESMSTLHLHSQIASSVVKVPVFEVVATDSGQRGLVSGQPYGHEVREQDAVEAIRLERPHIVIASWQVLSKAGQGERGPLASLKTQPHLPHPAKGVTLVYPLHFSYTRHVPKYFLDLGVTRATRANARNRAGSQGLARSPRSPSMGSVTIFTALLSFMLPIDFDVCKAPSPSSPTRDVLYQPHAFDGHGL